MSHDCKRREFMGGLASTLGVLSLSGMSLNNRLAYAADNQKGEYKDRYFVFLFMHGGWDVLLSIDPRDPTVFTESKKGLTLIQPGYQHVQLPAGANPLVDTAIGPLGYFAGEAVNHADKIAIVRGISMETLAHDTARRRLITGKAPVGTEYRGSSFDVWATSFLGKDNIIPNIAIRQATVNLDQPGYATAMRVGSPNEIYNALKRKSPHSVAQEAAIQALLNGAQECPDALNSPFKQKADSARVKIAQLLEANMAESFNMNGKTEEITALKAHYADGKSLQGAMRQMGAVSQALKTGVARVVTVHLEHGGSLDSHNDMVTNGPQQLTGFNAFARLIDDLSKSQYKDTTDSWLDRTTVILASEFARAAHINTLGGRDHWLMNGMVLAGGDVKGGQVIGASSDIGMAPQAINLQTGAVDVENGELLKPEHIHQTLLNGIGVSGDPADYRAKRIDALLKG